MSLVRQTSVCTSTAGPGRVQCSGKAFFKKKKMQLGTCKCKCKAVTNVSSWKPSASTTEQGSMCQNFIKHGIKRALGWAMCFSVHHTIISQEPRRSHTLLFPGDIAGADVALFQNNTGTWPHNMNSHEVVSLHPHPSQRSAAPGPDVKRCFLY